MVIFNQEKCILCRKCMQDCYPQAIHKENEKMTVSGECMLCGHCVAICPKEARYRFVIMKMNRRNT